MEKTSVKKVTVSYMLTSVLIFTIMAITNVFGLFGKGVGDGDISMSIELMMLVQLTIVLVANFLLHLFFYYAGFQSSPITKGLSIGAVIGVVYFFVTIFAFNVYDINSEAVTTLVGAVAGRVLEFTTGGVATAVISVSEIHRWGLLKSF